MLRGFRHLQVLSLRGTTISDQTIETIGEHREKIYMEQQVYCLGGSNTSVAGYSCNAIYLPSYRSVNLCPRVSTDNHYIILLQSSLISVAGSVHLHKCVLPGILTLTPMGGLWTDISKCSEGEGRGTTFFFIGTFATKRFARSRIFRYGLFHDILSKRRRKRE